MQQLNVSLRMHRDGSYIADWAGAAQARRWKIEITDEQSNLPLGHIWMTDSEWASMHTGSGGNGVAEILDEADLPRLGKARWNIALRLDYDWRGETDLPASQRYGRASREALQVHVEGISLAQRLEAAYVRVDAHNDGLGIVAVGYADDHESAIKEAAAAATLLDLEAERLGWKVKGSTTSNPREVK